MIMNLYIFFLIGLPVAYLNNYDEIPYEVITYERKCETRYAESCSGRWFLRRCHNYSYPYCWTISNPVVRYNRTCHTGWSYPSSGCIIPVCSNGCPIGQYCTYPNNCSEYEPCSPVKNCYPGTCLNGSCICDPSFNGSNCQNTLKIPEIKDCTVKIINASNFENSFNCSPVPYQIPSMKSSSIESVVVSYKVEYLTKAHEFPPSTDLISKFGIVASLIKLKWDNKEVIMKCDGLSSAEPVFSKQCNITWTNDGNQDLKAITIIKLEIEAVLGGFKKSAKIVDSNFIFQNYSADFKAARFATFQYGKDPTTSLDLTTKKPSFFDIFRPIILG